MEVFFAFLVLGCALLLSLLNSAGDAAREAQKQVARLPAPPPPAGRVAVGLPKPRSGMEGDRQRKEQVLKTIEESPEEVALTLKQWLQE